MKVVASIRHIFFHAANDNAGASGISDDRLRRALFPPHDDTQETLHGVIVKDPFRPLEALDDPSTAEWVSRQNDNFRDSIAESKEAMKSVLTFLMTTATKEVPETMPDRYGNKYFVWRHERGSQRQSYHVKDGSAEAPPRLLLDAKKIDPSGKTVITKATPSPDGKIIAYTLNRSGSDAGTLRFLDVAKGTAIDITIPKFRSGVIWDADSRGFHYGYAKDTTPKINEVRHHKMGTPLSEDKTIYSPATPETSASYIWKSSAYEWISLANNERGKNALLIRPVGSTDTFREIFPLENATLFPITEAGGKVYAITTYNAPKGRIILFDPQDPAPDKWQSIVPENREDTLAGMFIKKGRIFAVYNHDTGDVIKAYDLNGAYLYDAPLPPLCTFDTNRINVDDTSCLLSISSFQEKDAIYKYDFETNTLSLFKKSITPVDLKDCIVERIYATSKDGTKVPMTVIRHPDTKLDGTAATFLEGYGGFNLLRQPQFNTSAAQWVRAGGIYIQANQRGDGGYGQTWYDQGRLKNKQNVFNDFIACAEHLVKEKYTSKSRLAIKGGSNGGLLTLATMIQRPDLFGAVVAVVPVTDMNRFHIGSHYGFTWKSDYGDPDIKADFNNAAKYSPLHNVKEGFRHPPCLIRTDANDDRVLPWHSYKMAATLESREDPASVTLLKTNTDGGHGAGQTFKQYAADLAETYAFLEKALGPINQQAYKAKLTAEQQARNKNKLASRVIRKLKRA